MSSQLSSSIAIDFISKMYLKSDFADIHFEFSGDNEIEKVPAHRAILATASPVFRQMLFGPLKEGDTIKIIDTNAAAFKEFLQFFYLDKITLTMENIGEVARLSDYYDVSDCFEKCADFLEHQLTSENTAWGYQLAIMFNNQKLKDFCEKQISIFTDDVLKSDMFLQCDQKVVSHILKIDSLNYKEVDLFGACISWAKASCERNELDENDPNNLKRQLGDCFNLIRFGAMEGEEIEKILSNSVYVGLFTRDELVDIMRLKWNKNFESQTIERTARLKLSSLWNGNNILYCDLKNAVGQASYQIQNTESTWFSSNKPLLLGSMVLATVTTYSGYNNFNCTIDIIEYDTCTFDTNARNNVLYTKSCNFGGKGRTVSLDTPILIKPRKAYEIRFQNKSTGCGALYHSYTWKIEVNLDDNIVVKLRDAPSNGNSDRQGLILGMNFNRFF